MIPNTVLEILAGSLFPLVVADERPHICRVTPSLLAMLGYPDDRPLLGQDVVILMPDRYREAHRRAFARYLATGRPTIVGKPLAMEMLRADGIEVPVTAVLSDLLTIRRYFILVVAPR